MKNKIESVEAQRTRYDIEASFYEEHHGHELNQLYRDVFVRNLVFDFDMKGKTVLDGMCASGIETGFLLSRGALVTGLDISPKNIDIYKKWGCPSYLSSIHQTDFPNKSFDVVYIFGGLHHVFPLLDETLREVHRILKPGGVFVFVEPNKDTFVNKFREIWYKMDNRFQDDEQSISYTTLVNRYCGSLFSEDAVYYGGNIAYILIEQSLILRTPKCIKELIYPIVFFLERTIGAVGIAPKLFFAARWKKI